MTDRLHLPQRYRRILEALLREHVPDAEVWAYGSRVTGESHDGCDLDLVVRGPELKPLGDAFFQLLEAIEKSNIPILVQGQVSIGRGYQRVSTRKLSETMWLCKQKRR